MKAIYKRILVIAIIVFGLFLSVITSYSNNKQDNSKIIQISELVKYTDSYIRGEVIKILDNDEFRLKDSSGRIKVYTGWKNTNLVKKGEIVTVRGILDPGIIKEFYATEIIRNNGEVIKLKKE